ncbi:MAG: WYL domain-containing protein [Deltaproteobacteria bacterium]|nr:WYL domain-containing protein [Deltaproteobacteria bacterium]
MPRNDQVVRIISLLRRLEGMPHGLCVHEEAGEDTTASRRLYRDLHALEEAGFPLSPEEVEGRKRWKLMDVFRRKGGVPLQLSEALALRWMRRAVDAPHASVFSEAIDSLIHKLDACLSPKLRSYAEDLDKVFVADRFGHTVTEELRPLVEALSHACAERKTVRITYCNQQGVESERLVDPYNLWLRSQGHYVLGLCHRRERVLTFAIWRIKDVVATEERFEVREDYSFDEFVQTHFRIMDEGQPEKVRISFAPEAALYVQERTWHPTQKVEPAPGGAIVLEMVVDGLSEVASWVLSFGPRAEVLEPASLVDDVRRQLTGALAGYDVQEKARIQV